MNYDYFKIESNKSVVIHAKKNSADIYEICKIGAGDYVLDGNYDFESTTVTDADIHSYFEFLKYIFEQLKYGNVSIVVEDIVNGLPAVIKFNLVMSSFVPDYSKLKESDLVAGFFIWPPFDLDNSSYDIVIPDNTDSGLDYLFLGISHK